MEARLDGTYFEGLNWVKNPTIKSVGLNKLDNYLFQQGDIGSNGLEANSTVKVRTNFINVLENTSYIASSQRDRKSVV